MDEQTFTQLNRLIDGHYEYLCERLDDLAGRVQAMHAATLARLDAHDEYHRRSEHRWGLVKLAERYPFRLATLAFLAAWVLVASYPGSAHWTGELAHRLLTILFR